MKIPGSSRRADTRSLSLVIPCFNEAECLPIALAEIYRRLNTVLAEWSCQWEVVLVDDGSTDGTWHAIQTATEQYPRLHGVRLTENVGQQAAILCGYTRARGHWVLTLDVDLQDPPEVVAEMLAVGGHAAIVIGRRRCRAVDGPMKRVSANIFYRFMRVLGVNSNAMHAGDFRLMSRDAIEKLIASARRPLFHRFAVFELGLPVALIEYDREARLAGSTKYSYAKMFRLANQAVWSAPSSRLRITCLFVVTQIVLSVVAAGSMLTSPRSTGALLATSMLQFIGFALFAMTAYPCFRQRSGVMPFYQIAEECWSASNDLQLLR